MNHNKKRLLLIFGLTIGALFLWLAMQNTDPSEVRSAFDQADWSFAPLVLLFLWLFLYVKTFRWKVLLTPIANIKATSLFPVVVVGYASNLLLPAQLGELVRTFLAGNKYRIANSPVLMTVLLERMFDLLTIMIFAGIILTTESEAPRELVLAGYICGAIGIAMLAVIVVHTVQPHLLSGLFQFIMSVFPDSLQCKLTEQFALATQGLESLRNFRLFTTVALTSLLQWALMGICTYAALLALNIDISLSAGFIVMTVIVVGMTIPSSPGFFGTIQLCFTIGLAPFGVDNSTALAASIFYHSIVVVSIGIGGLLFMRYLGYSAGSLLKEAQPH